MGASKIPQVITSPVCVSLDASLLPGLIQGISYDQHLDKILCMVSKLTYFVALYSELNWNSVKWTVFFVALIMVISNFIALIG